ncbi:MAG: ABC transporter ATP-binding protein [Candidatus Dadabacteria bacterium]|nr:MAG: ABC transporter ATP-binding protein [Candidatus Dadabacteria bacterium]
MAAEGTLDMAEELTSKSCVEYVIDIVSLSKTFKRCSLKKSDYTTVKSRLLNLFKGRPHSAATVDALSNITIRVPKGASFGIIGRNGSGKSTLLKIITGIYKPTSGVVNVSGRVSALIELGAGFHPDFSGRENIFLGGALHGLANREIEERFEEIVNFAGLEEVIDDPVRTYSSGMYMRLGFSLAVHTDPDILLVDEVLSVGDASFVTKCKDKIDALRKEGKTLLLVSHDLAAVERWCDEVLWLEKGKEMDRGNPRRVIDAYRSWIEKGEEKELVEDAAKDRESEEDGSVGLFRRWGSREIEIISIRTLNADMKESLMFHTGESLSIEIKYRTNQDVDDRVFGVGINRLDGLVVLGSNTDLERVDVPPDKKEGRVLYKIMSLDLAEGTYSVDAAVHRSDGYPYDYHQAAVKFMVKSPFNQAGVYLPEHKWEFGDL